MEPLTFNVPCLFPYHVKNARFTGLPGSERYIPVPCGTCPDCLVRRTNGWQFRLLEQEKISRSAHFVTLTYDTTTVPISGKGYMTLSKRDYQLFMKRLRKLHPKTTKISYYAVGEYGSQHKRPHYHAILFNVIPEHVVTAWGNGSVFIGTVSGASVSYTLKYMHKGRIIPEHRNDDRLPEFSLMSKKMGLGYLTPAMVEYHQNDINRNYVTLEGGQKIAMPRYFRERIYSEQQRADQGELIKAKSAASEEKLRTEYAQRTGTPDHYEKHKHESKKQAIRNFKSRSQENRKAF